MPAANTPSARRCSSRSTRTMIPSSAGAKSAMWGGPHGVTATVIEREIAPLIMGQDPRRPEYLWEKVFQETYYHGRRGHPAGGPLGRRYRPLGYSRQVRGPAAVAAPRRLRPAGQRLCLGRLLPARLRARCLRRRCRQGAGRGLSRLQDEDRQYPPGRALRRAARCADARLDRRGSEARGGGARSASAATAISWSTPPPP